MGLEEAKQSMDKEQAKYRDIISKLGHARANRLNFQKQEEEHEQELLIIMKKIATLEANMPKEEPKTEESK